jgi:hypothetical protein
VGGFKVKGSAYAFAAEVDRKIESFSRNEDLKRKGPCKRLLEEILPISRLALSFKYPGCEVEVEAFEDSGPIDGRIRVTGFREEEFDIQATCVYSHEESLRDELLAQQGVVPGFGPIYREKRSKRIVAEGQCTDVEETLENLSSAIVVRFQKKVEKGATHNTDLLIAFDDITLYGHSLWARLLHRIDRLGGLSGSDFKRVFLLNCATNQLYRAA